MYIRGFPAPRGAYSLRVCTTAREDERREARVSGGNSGGGGRGAGGREEGRQGQGQGQRQRRLEEVEDLWVLSYVLAPPDVRIKIYYKQVMKTIKNAAGKIVASTSPKPKEYEIIKTSNTLIACFGERS